MSQYLANPSLDVIPPRPNLLPSALLLGAALLIPLAGWLAGADLDYYRYYPALPGQGWYLASKLFGLCAVWLAASQALSGLLRYWPRMRGAFSHYPHRYLGPLTLLLIVAHFMCFAWGVSVRKEAFAAQLFWPNFSDFYHGMISLGLLAAVLALLGGVARRLRHGGRALHNLMVPAVVLALVHSYAIGTETRWGVMSVLHLVLLGLVLAAAAVAWRHGWRPWR